jgi:glutamyl-tRNA reductase
MNENKGGEKTGEGKGELIPGGEISLSPETTKISSEIGEKDKNKEEIIKKQLEKKLEDFLALGEEDRIQDVLEEVIGNKLEKEDLEKVMVLLRGKEGGLISRIAGKLIEKYGEEPLSRILRAVSGFDEMVNDSMELIESEVAKEVKNCYNELQRKGELKMNLPKLALAHKRIQREAGK